MMIPVYVPNILINLHCGTLVTIYTSLHKCILKYDHDHNQNYVNVNDAHNQNHARSQNSVALAGKKLGIVIIQIMYAVS